MVFAEDTMAGDLSVMLGRNDGKPFLTRQQGVPTYKRDDASSRAPAPCRQVCNDILKLWEKEDQEKYNLIWDGVGLGVVQVAMEERQAAPDHGSWSVFIRWYIPADMDPTELRGAKTSVISLLSGLKENNSGNQP